MLFDQRNGKTKTAFSLPLEARHLWELSHVLWRGFNQLVTWLLALFTSVGAALFFFVLNRTTVRGAQHLRGVRKNTLFLSNHQTMIDSFLIGAVLTLPRLLFRPSLLPWHPAAQENFFAHPILAWFSTRWKCIPVRRGQRDFQALDAMTVALREGTMLLYPEGGRSRTGEIGEGRPGTGKLIHDTGARCVPIRIRGMERVLPIGKRFPRLFQRIEVTIGEPIPMEDLLEAPSSKETSRRVVHRVMEEIRNL